MTFPQEKPATLLVNGKPFVCPASMQGACADVFAGEYALAMPYDEIMRWAPRVPKRDSVILDVGANCGAFVVWATALFEPSLVHAYEPHPEAWQYLEKNAVAHNIPLRAENVAVTANPRPLLWRGLMNMGESSTLRSAKHRDDDAIRVESVLPSTLPAAHIVKVDTEGCEVEIFEGLDLSLAEIVMCEFHSSGDEKRIRELLSDFELFSGYWRNPETGVLRFRRRHEENPKP